MPPVVIWILPVAFIPVLLVPLTSTGAEMTNVPAAVAPLIVSADAAVTGAEMLTVPEVRALALMPPVPRVRPPPGFAAIASPAELCRK